MLNFPTNYDIAELFFELAELTQLSTGKRDDFKAKAYTNGAWALLDVDERATELTLKELQSYQGIGKSIASKVAEYRTTGSVGKLDELREQIPVDMVQLSRLSGIGMNKLDILKTKLGVESLDALHTVRDSGELKATSEFGPKGEAKIDRQLQQTAPQGSVPISMAVSEAKIFAAKYSLGDVGLMSTSELAKVADFASSIKLVVPTKEHQRLIDAGLEQDGDAVCGCSQRYELPVEVFDEGKVKEPSLKLLGDLHFHTDASGDGKSSLENMVNAAKSRGIKYIAITDHAEDLRINGLSQKEMIQNRKDIEKVAAEHPDMSLLFGAELNIGPEGELDYTPKFRSEFEYTVASVHSHFELDSQQQTKRLVKAISDPTVHSIGHLSGRKIGRRAGIEFDTDIVVEALATFDVALELNSSLDRLDATREVVTTAVNRGVQIVINSDSHHTTDLERLYFGALLAEDLGLKQDQILNAQPYENFLEWLEQRS